MSIGYSDVTVKYFMKGDCELHTEVFSEIGQYKLWLKAHSEAVDVFSVSGLN
jgi:hypothetical protein